MAASLCTLGAGEPFEIGPSKLPSAMQFLRLLRANGLLSAMQTLSCHGGIDKLGQKGKW